MNGVRYALAIVLLLFGILVVVHNWAYVIITIRNQRRGIDRHISPSMAVSVVCTVLAYLVYPGTENDKLWMLVIPLLDLIAIYVLIRNGGGSRSAGN
jgi:hypothetical protein